MSNFMLYSIYLYNLWCTSCLTDLHYLAAEMWQLTNTNSTLSVFFMNSASSVEQSLHKLTQNNISHLWLSVNVALTFTFCSSFGKYTALLTTVYRHSQCSSIIMTMNDPLSYIRIHTTLNNFYNSWSLYYLRRVNRVNGADTVFVWCVSVRSGLVNQTSLKR